jgi:hypothetical protein
MGSTTGPECPVFGQTTCCRAGDYVNYEYESFRVKSLVSFFSYSCNVGAEAALLLTGQTAFEELAVANETTCF